MKIWLDSVRPAPEGYIWCKSVNQARACIIKHEDIACEHYSLATKKILNGKETEFFEQLELGSKHFCELLDMDHDLGNYAADGGDGVKLLDWLEETDRNCPIRIHSANPVGVANMRQIIERNGWTEVF